MTCRFVSLPPRAPTDFGGLWLRPRGQDLKHKVASPMLGCRDSGHPDGTADSNSDVVFPGLATKVHSTCLSKEGGHPSNPTVWKGNDSLQKLTPSLALIGHNILKLCGNRNYWKDSAGGLAKGSLSVH